MTESAPEAPALHFIAKITALYCTLVTDECIPIPREEFFAMLGIEGNITHRSRNSHS